MLLREAIPQTNEFPQITRERKLKVPNSVAFKFFFSIKKKSWFTIKDRHRKQGADREPAPRAQLAHGMVTCAWVRGGSIKDRRAAGFSQELPRIPHTGASPRPRPTALGPPLTRPYPGSSNDPSFGGMKPGFHSHTDLGAEASHVLPLANSQGLWGWGRGRPWKGSWEGRGLPWKGYREGRGGPASANPESSLRTLAPQPCPWRTGLWPLSSCYLFSEMFPSPKSSRGGCLSQGSARASWARSQLTGCPDLQAPALGVGGPRENCCTYLGICSYLPSGAHPWVPG